MIILTKATQALDFLKRPGNQGLRVGFVPTMGALHEGHISLIAKAKEENDVVVSSIFVNPTQFNDPKDLVTYPKTPEKDHKMLEQFGCDMLFEPEASEIYSASYQPPAFDFGLLESVMEGRFRPGHFKGVAMVDRKSTRLNSSH